MWKRLSVAYIVGLSLAVITLGQAATSSAINDVKLLSVRAARLGQVADLQPRGVITPDTPIFVVQFSTATDLVGLANQFDSYTLRNSVLVGAACTTPDPKMLSASRVSEIMLSYPEVYDDLGNLENRAGANGPVGGYDRIYHFYFGVRSSALSEFLVSGLQEAPICFVLRGGTFSGRSLSSNIVQLPPQVLAEAASRLEGR